MTLPMRRFWPPRKWQEGQTILRFADLMAIYSAGKSANPIVMRLTRRREGCTVGVGWRPMHISWVVNMPAAHLMRLADQGCFRTASITEEYRGWLRAEAESVFGEGW